MSSRRHVLERSQLVRRPLPEVFGFFSNAANLEAITPPFLRFRVLTPPPIEMRAGTLIDYRLSLLGISFKWRTLIEIFEPNRRFTDTQVRGPYRRWRHLHEFHATSQGTRMIDRVQYELPLGWIGDLVHSLAVRRSLEKIFDYRRDRIRELLESGPGSLLDRRLQELGPRRQGQRRHSSSGSAAEEKW